MLRASFAGGLWALLLSTSGLSFASVMTEIPDRSDWAIQVAAVAPDAAAQNATSTAPVVATSVVVPIAPQDQASPLLNSVAPVVMASFDPAMGTAPAGTSPDWPDVGLHDGVVSSTPTIIAQPALPAAPLLATVPAAAQIAQQVKPQAIAKAPTRPQFDDLIVRVQADANDNGGLVQRRLPQILPDTPEATDAPTLDAGDGAQADTEETDIQIGIGGGNILEQDEPSTQEPGVVAEGEQVIVDAPPTSALNGFAANFENPNNLPIVGVVLIDDGSLLNGPLQVFESGFKSTIVIDALRADATLWSEAYREAGMEIAMQVPLPLGVQPSDVEVAYAAAKEILPEAAFLYSDGEGVLRNDRKAAQQVMSILANDGYGFVTQERGLGALVREAERNAVPVAQIWRDLDRNGESVNTMSRTLDRAAFTARQSGGVVVVGRLQPLTLEVLSVWALNAEREGVLLAPVSALLVPPIPASEADADPTDAEAPVSSLPTITE